jgi:hypothetical protein
MDMFMGTDDAIGISCDATDSVHSIPLAQNEEIQWNQAGFHLGGTMMERVLVA